MFKKKYGYDSSEGIKVILEDKKARTCWVEFKNAENKRFINKFPRGIKNDKTKFNFDSGGFP